MSKTVPAEVHTFGTAQAHLAATVRSQVGGELQKVHFAQGQVVKAGEVLFTVDPRSFQATVDQLQAKLARDTTEAGLAQRQAQRLENLFNKGDATEDELDTNRTAAKAAQETVQADKAALENARLQLSYCTIRSPITGVAGPWLIDQGNVIKANDDALVTINQIQPIDVSFTVPEKDLPEIRTLQAKHPLRVQAFVPSESAPEIGHLTFIDNTVDTQTGSITLLATFANPDDRLWPGQYVNVVLRLKELSNAVVIPSQAIQDSQQGTFVFVVESNDTVRMQPVQAGLAVNGQTVIESGLRPGQVVVTDGQLNLVPGSHVQIQSGLLPKTGPAGASAGKERPTTRPAGLGSLATGKGSGGPAR